MASNQSTGVLDGLAQYRVLPVVVLHDSANAIPLARALAAGGLPIAEVTFRTAAAVDSIRQIAREMPDMVVGAGTVLTADQVGMAQDAGAQFLVSPGFNPKVVAEAARRGIPIVPGVNNPTSVEMAMDAGLDILKFFPAGASGGIAMLKSLGGPYGDVRFVPTGGIGPKNIGEYLALPNVLACGGSWMVDPKLVAAGQYDTVTTLTREAISIAQSA